MASMHPSQRRPGPQDRRLEKLLWANNIIFPVALILSAFFRYATLLALLFWLYVLVQLIRRDISAKKVSPVTLFYGVLGLAIAVLVVYALIYPALH